MSDLSRLPVALRARRLLQGLRAARRDADHPYSAVASLTLLLAVGIAVKLAH